MADIIIVGAGPAGLSAAIYARRAGMDTVLYEGEMYGGQIVNTPEIENYPAIAKISGFDFAQDLYNQAINLGAVLEFDRVASVSKIDTGFEVALDSGAKNTAKAVILAVGASNRHLGIAREEELLGKGISYCATCDGAFFRKRKCAVVGGGDVAFEDAIYLSKLARIVYLIHRRDAYRAAPTLVTQAKAIENIEFITDTVVRSINGSDMVESLTLSNVKTGETSNLEVDGVFIATGIIPENVLFGKIANCDENGYLIANEDCETSCPGLFVAGDLRTKQLRQIITAAADGANAVTSAIRFLG